jgi:pimeloyl-ACP methyl ester carboxylesterase
VKASPAAYSKIEAPTLIIAGGEDNMAPLENCKFIQSKIGSNADIKVVDGAGHWLCLETPDQVAHAIGKFLTAGSGYGCTIS